MRALSNTGLRPLARLKLISVSEHSIIMLHLVQHHILVGNGCFLALLSKITCHRQLDTSEQLWLVLSFHTNNLNFSLVEHTLKKKHYGFDLQKVMDRKDKEKKKTLKLGWHESVRNHQWSDMNKRCQYKHVEHSHFTPCPNYMQVSGTALWHWLSTLNPLTTHSVTSCKQNTYLSAVCWRSDWIISQSY